jgi:hypothetical protein
MRHQTQIEQRVIQAAQSILEVQHYISPIDILVKLTWLQPVHVQDWKKGRIPYLEQVIQINLKKISFAMTCFQNWAHRTKLKQSTTAYLARTRGPKKELRFSKSGNLTIEEAYRTHYVSPLLSEKKQEKIKEKWEQPPDLVAFMIITPTCCSSCKEELFKGRIIFLEEKQPLCLSCAGFGDLVFLASGNLQLTRVAKKYSTCFLVVVQFSRARKRYERHGLLIQKDALQKANTQRVEHNASNFVRSVGNNGAQMVFKMG